MSKPKAVIEIVDLLNTFLPSNLYALDFSASHYNSLLDKLKIAKDEKLFELKKGTLIDGIVEYFNLSFQAVSVEISLHNCTITKHFTDDTSSELLDRMLYKHSKLLIDISQQKDAYRTLPYLLSIPEKTRDLLLKGFIDKNESMEKARKMLRLQIQPIFNLGERDITFFLRGRIWIRYYTPPKKVLEGEDKRYAGESQEELAAMYKLYFPNGIWKDIESILSEVLEEKLNFSIIDNATFAKTFIPVFRGMIEILLIDVMSPNDRHKIEGFTGYILRIYFDKILLCTAKNLLLFIEKRDKNAEVFIKTFSDDTLIDSSGKKTKKHAIVDEKQQTWNYVTILSILMQYKQAKLRTVSQNNILSTAKGQLKQSEENLKFETHSQEIQEAKIDKIIKKIADSELVNFQNNKGSDPAQTKRHEDLLSIKRTEENELYLIKNRIANTIIELSRQKKKLKHEIEAKNILNEQIEPLKETYERIAKALALVLTKR
ncbi:MAG: hypothetical protein Q8N01_08320 [Sulfuricurvum sp.]|nr:hypothetical protein [Sulfuricurvum sp.]MDP3022039.1 hypothetical protein [Sulfuricurvum sp.]MDP3120405.1 hypothetical protein [Sulfuricurvum sp.]